MDTPGANSLPPRPRFERARNLRGVNHPVTAGMVQQGQSEHQNYQRNSWNCHVDEFSMNSVRAECLIAAGMTFYVVELKPDNSRALRKGLTHSNDYGKAFEVD
jgi:hypothetical protein